MSRQVLGRANLRFNRYLGQGPALQGLLLSSAALITGCGSNDSSPAAGQQKAAVSAPSVLGTARSALITNAVLNVVGDTFVRQGLPNENEGTDDQLSVQTSSIHRTLLFFDTAAIQAAVGNGTLTSARIDMFIAMNGGGWGTGRPVSIHSLRRASSESGATWSCALDSNTGNQLANCSGDTAWNMLAAPADLPFVPAATATTTMTNGRQGVLSFDVTNDVVAMLAGTLPGHGWLIKKVDEVASGAVRFASREQGPSPRLTLTIDAPDLCTPTAIADTTCDGVDDDCDGDTDEEVPQVETTCGTGSCAAAGMLTCVGGQMQDSCAPGTPAAFDQTCDTIDDDCDGVVDEDYVPVLTSCGVGACGAQGTTSCVLGAVVDSCEPGAPAAADASCDGVDQDCDGSADEEYVSLATQCGLGACQRSGSTSCAGGVVVDGCTPGPAALLDATCDTIDEDCDGVVDEDYAPVLTSCGVGACGAQGTTSCVLGDVVDGCEPGTPGAADASCDGVDQDCDGSTDEEYVSLATECGIGACRQTGSTSCAGGAVVDDCEPSPAASQDASCDGVDDDCDGSVDEEFAPTCAGSSSVSCVSGVLHETSCLDQNVCNGVEACTGAGACVAGAPAVLDDEDPCTVDACAPETGVAHTQVAAGTSCGNYRECSATGQCVSLLPADPSDVAPGLLAGNVSLLDRVRFMFEGAAPIQTNVTPGVISSRSVAVLRGRVLDASGQPLPQVTVSVHGHPEFGQTLSRIDGVYDLVVNGGGPLTLSYRRGNLVEAQRTVQAPWQDYESVDDLALSGHDVAVTHAGFPTAAPVIHSGSPAEDARGARRARLFVATGTGAVLTLPDGTQSTASALSLRTSELGVGLSGSVGLAALLPETGASVYAVDLSADEALAAQARGVALSRAASLYVDNFIDLPVGLTLPLGAYDRSRAAWSGTRDGRVLALLGANAGLADLDIDGSGTPATPAALTALGISTEERAAIVGLYSAGATFFRLPVDRLATFGVALPFRAAEATGGAAPSVPGQLAPLDDATLPAAPVVSGVLQKSLPLLGTPFTLTYRSDRVPGDKRGQRIAIEAFGNGIQPGVESGLVDVRIAGQNFRFEVPPAPKAHVDFTWDGTDVAGRPLHGWQRVSIRLGVLSDKSYLEPEDVAGAFSHTAFGGAVVGEAPEQFVRWNSYERLLHTFDSRQTDIGAWAIDQHHQYDPKSRVVYKGDGSSFAARTRSVAINRFAGIAQTVAVGQSSGDGGQALLARMDSPRSLAVAADGALFIGTRRGVRRVDAATGIITTVAGTSNPVCDTLANEGPATSLCIFAHSIDFARDGTLVIGDAPASTAQTDRIRRLDLKTGHISHVAGVRPTTGCTNMGDGGLARDAALCDLTAHATAPDGSIYVLDRGSSTNALAVRKISTDGIIDTIAHANWGAAEDSAAIAAGPDGSVYIAQTRSVLRVRPTGETELFAGNLTANGNAGEGGPAVLATFGNGGPSSVSFGADGRVYIGDTGNAQIRMVDQAGIIRRVAGGVLNTSGDGGAPLLAGLGTAPVRTALAPDGTMYLTSRSNHTVRVVRPTIAGDFTGEALVRSLDGSETYRFAADGRHLDTTHVSSGVVLYSFGYDGAQRLVSVTDVAGDSTTIERDAEGNPVKLIAPSGDETLLDTNGSGYISTFISPNGDETDLSYDASGLLTGMVDASGTHHQYSYAADGRWLAP